jgi:hypothetical protein
MAYAAERTRPYDEGDGRWLYEMRLEQPFDDRRKTLLAIATYRRTDDDEFGQVGDVENTLAALFFHYDYKDWFEREGFNVEAATTPWDRWTFSGVTSWRTCTTPLGRSSTRSASRRLRPTSPR